MGYRADIDGLRAIAVLLVLIFHFNLFDIGASGFVGVDIFFVISGYLISRITWRELTDGRFSFAAFYTRRVRRLAPPLFVTAALTLLVAAVVLLPGETYNLAKEILASQFYVSNVFYWRTISYFGFAGERSFMLHTWSLAVEEQFYLLFPAFLVLVHRWAPNRLFAALIGLLIVSFAINLILMDAKPQADFYILPARAWEFAVGALIPFIARRTSSPAGSFAAFCGGILLIVLSLLLYTPSTPFPGWFAILPTLGAACLILAGERPGGIPGRILSFPPLVMIGRISYSLYLVHWPIRVFAGLLLVDYAPAWRWACFALSFVLAGLMFVLVEEPTRHGRLRTGPRRTFQAYGLSLLILAGVSGSALASGGWPGRFTPQVNRIAAAQGDRDPISRRCQWAGGVAPLDTCPIGATGTTPTWLLVGDSHAAALRQAFSLWLHGRGEAGLFVFLPGCLPLPDTGGEECRAFNRAISTLLRRRPELANVVLASPWRQPIEAAFVDRNGRSVRGAQAIAAFDVALSTRLSELATLGRRAIIWEPVPGARLSVPEGLARQRALGGHDELRFDRADYDRTFSFALSAFNRNAHLIAARISPARALCGSGKCAIMDQGRPIYSDSAHPAFSQAPLFAAIIDHDLARFGRH